MSQATPFGRAAPRWSVGGQPAPEAGTPSMAGLPNRSARVRVGPPLFASPPSFGSTSAPGQLESPNEMSWPPSVIAPEQLGAALPATMLFVSVVAPVNKAFSPPPLPGDPGEPKLTVPAAPGVGATPPAPAVAMPAAPPA